MAALPGTFVFGRVGASLDVRQQVLSTLREAASLGMSADRANAYLRRFGLGYNILAMRQDYKYVSAFKTVSDSQTTMRHQAEVYDRYIRPYMKEHGVSASEAWKDFRAWRGNGDGDALRYESYVGLREEQDDWVPY